MRQTKILLSASHYAIPKGLCRLPLAPAGSWPFPTLSPQSLHGCLDPYPVAFLQCSYPFLPGKLRPRRRAKKLGTPDLPVMQLQQRVTFETAVIPLCLSLHACLVSRLHLPLCCRTGQPDLLHHAYPGWLPAPGCGIATCLNRVIDMTGLSPAGSRPYRLLLAPDTPGVHLSVLAVFVRTGAPAFLQ